MTDLPPAVALRRGPVTAALHGRVCLDYDTRFLRRRRLVTEAGEGVMVDLPETTSLEDGDALVLSDGRLVGVTAAAEPLIEVRGDLARLAWHVGNRHTPCRIESGRLLIRQDHVLRAMLVRLGATVTDLVAPFSPEGGAYGMGRTMGHDHGGAAAHAHAHDHQHDHGPDCAHGQAHRPTAVHHHGSHLRPDDEVEGLDAETRAAGPFAG